VGEGREEAKLKKNFYENNGLVIILINQLI
jgi:hypothetical protein